ncbi:MAG TPA: hypothetical protein VL284_13465 [Thermoanaerobaculia bacterium]|nr:hypothetical protein [Thermoanaerobaculia bacterium]
MLTTRKSETIAVLEALERWRASSDAEFVVVSLEDCRLEEEPPNVPGMPERSWRKKCGNLSWKCARTRPSRTSSWR